MTGAPTEASERLAAAIAAHQRGNLDEAEAAYRAVVAAEPANAEGLHLLGVIQFQRGRHEEAVSFIETAIRHNGAKAEYHSNLSLPLAELGHHAAAAGAAERAVSLNPAYAEAYANRGLAQLALNDYGAASESFEEAVRLKPRFAGFHNNLGNAYRALRRWSEAESSYGRAVELQPAHRHAWYGLGMAQYEQEKYPEALVSMQKAVKLDDSLAEAHATLGMLLTHLGMPDEAAQCAGRALSLNPDDVIALRLATTVSNYVDSQDASHTRDLAVRHAARLREFVGEPDAHANRPDPDRPIRVGLLSGDLAIGHPVGAFLAAILPELDRSSIELFAYNTRRPRGLHDYLFREWRYIDSVRTEAAATLIRGDEIDILVDLSGYTEGGRPDIIEAKPAPVQVSWLGYSGTTGSSNVDYILSDRWVIPEGEEGLYSEAPWRLPDSYLCWTPPAEVRITRPPVLESSTIAFGSFNKFNKISAATAGVWARVLAAVPDGRLVLKSSRKVAPEAHDRVLRMLAAAGAPLSRIDLLERTDGRAAHFEQYNQLDIALDPFPYNGTTTTVEALWMGLPVVTLKGHGFVSRVGESILHTTGHPEWIADDEDDYVRRAVALASDVDALAELRTGLRSQLLASPLCDAPRFGRNLTQAFREMWVRWCADQRGT